ncbi:MAG: acyl-CoA thioesterase domain-containing protein [Mycobacterium sp.]
MTDRPAHFEPKDGHFLPQKYANSHWGDDHLNGPAIVGLAARTMEIAYGSPEFMPTRLTVDLFKAARNQPTEVRTRLVRDGRRVRNAECEVAQGDTTVARATLVLYRRSSAPPGEQWAPATDFSFPADVHSDTDESVLPYTGSDEVGWTRKVGDHQNSSRTRFLDKAIDVVAGQPNSPFVKAAMLAESTSLTTNLGTHGIGYINGDLTVALARLPMSDWVGVQAESHWAADGIAVGTATLFDTAGPFGTGVITAVANPAVQIDFTTTGFQGLRI